MSYNVYKSCTFNKVCHDMLLRLGDARHPKVMVARGEYKHGKAF